MMTKKTAPYLFLLPMVILFAIFMVYPVINSLILSFQDFTEGRYVFCGLQNYITMLHDPVFMEVFKKHVYLSCDPGAGDGGAVFGTWVLVEQAFLKCRTGFRISIFLPAVTALVAYAIVFKLLLIQILDWSITHSEQWGLRA